MNKEDNMNRLLNAKQVLLAMQRHSWEHGTAMNAVLETGDMKTLIRMAIEAAYRRVDDGRTAMVAANNAVTDPVSPGTGILASIDCLKGNLEAIRGGKAPEDTSLGISEEEILKALDILEPAAAGIAGWVRERAPRDKNGILHHVMNAPEFWADSMYMLPPYLSAAGEKAEAVKQMRGFFDAMFDPDASLLIHIANAETRVWTDPHHWATGNGWALMGYAMLLADPAIPEREELIREYLLILNGMLPWQTEDGLFHDFLDDDSTFVDAAAPIMTAASIYRGIKDGWLDRKYLDAAERMRLGAEARQDAFGFIHGACGAPTFDKSGMSPEAQASFVIMESLALQM